MKNQPFRITLLIIAVLAALPGFAWAQTPEEQIQNSLERAEEAGIPKSLLELKISEGKAKGVSMDRIAAAVASRLAGLEKAHAALARVGGNIDEAQLSVSADALGAGVSEAVLEKIAATTGRERRTVAIAALTHLVSQGVVPEAALARVEEALARGPQALANLASQPGQRGVSATTPGAGPSSGTGPADPPAGPPATVPAPGQANPPAVPQRGGPSGRGGF